jgi:uncharacterized protein (TIGR02246 family)
VSLSVDDRIEIAELVARADLAATRRDPVAYSELFALDGRLDGDQGEHHGRAALREAVGRVWAGEGAASAHLTLNTVIDPDDDHPDQATVTSLLVILELSAPPTVRSVSLITQVVAKTDGRWLVEHRSVAPG